MAKVRSVMLLLLVGCSSTVDSTPAEKPVDVEAFISSVDTQAKALATTLAAQKLTGEQTLETAQAIMAKLNTLEACLAKSEPKNGKDGDPASAQEPPAKANTTPDPLKVATPGAFRTASDGTRLRWSIEGNWNPTILETSAHLGQEHGINTDGMTHQEMADLHAALHDGKTEEQAVSGAMFQRRGASAIVSKSSAVRPVSQRGSSIQWSNYSTQQSCPSGRCPQRRSR